MAHTSTATHEELCATIDEQKAKIGQLLREKYEPIAVIGAGIRFPGGNETLDGFADFLRTGSSGIRPVPQDRWDVSAFAANGAEQGRVRTTSGGFLNQIDQFDPQFFNISPKEAPWVDPQQRLLLETTWEALESANIDPASLRHGNGGVYVGTSSVDYALELDSIPYPDLDGKLATGMTAYPMSGRLSYFLGWRGPSLSVDTACASSLTALHLAVEGLRRRDCDIAVAAGVNCLHHPRIFVIFSEGGMLAPDGQCKTFDESANGYARAEGCASILLKRLSDARRDGDQILALVRGSAIRQDGASAGLTVPSGTSQELVMRAALANGMLKPTDVQYVEAHGTGTPLGDPIEMGSICDVFAGGHTDDDPLVVGSLKTNIGHMEPAAGLGGVVKCILQMRESVIFPHLNMTNPSGRIPWDSYPVVVPTECRPWQAPVRRAVVNGFGFAGAVSSVVLEQAPPVKTVDADDALRTDGHVLTLSAKSRQALRLQVDRYRGHLADHPDLDAGDLCHTTNVGRSHFNHRLAAVVDDRAALVALLDRAAADLDATTGTPRTDIRKIAFLFTGQGAQYRGMGAALYRRYPVFRQHVDECDALFGEHIGVSVRAIMFGETTDPALIHQTRYTQPALFTLEYALAKLWLSWGVRPNALIGHSIGEVVAATIAGVFGLADAVRLVAVRGRLMQSVSAPGGMVAVTAPVAEIAPYVDDYADVSIAAVNSPRQCVVSGGRQSLEDVSAKLVAAGYSITELKVSHAFHSPLMAEVFDEFRAGIAGIELREPRLPVVSNVTGQLAGAKEMCTPEYWVNHIGAAVQFEAGMHAVVQRGHHVFIEIGPSGSLTSLASQCVPAAEHLWVASLRSKDRSDTTIRNAAATLYTAGINLSWPECNAGSGYRKVAVPTYAFDRRSYWLPVRGERHGLGAGIVAQPAHPLLGREVIDAAGGIREFGVRLSSQSPAYLAEHVVQGTVMFPATGYLELLVALRDAVDGDDRREITDLRLHEALLLPDRDAVAVRTRLRPDGDNAMVEVVTQLPGADGVIERRHASAVLTAPTRRDGLSPAGRELLAQAMAAGEPDRCYTPDEVYAAYSRAGVEFGPGNRLLREAARFGADLAIGELDAPRAGAVEHVPPLLLDASTHLLGVLAADHDRYLTVHIGGFRLLKKPRAQRLRTIMRLRPPTEPNLHMCADVLVLEGDVPVWELTGLGLRRVAAERKVRTVSPRPDARSSFELGTVLALPAARRRAELGALVRRATATVLQIDDPDSIDPRTEFLQLGLDSLVAVELKDLLERALAVALPASLAFDHPRVESLTEFLDDQLAPVPTV